MSFESEGSSKVPHWCRSIEKMINDVCVIDGSIFDERLHDEVREALQRGPLAVDETTGGFVVLRYRDVEALAHNPRLAGVGLTIFDFLGVSAGPLRDCTRA